MEFYDFDYESEFLVHSAYLLPEVKVEIIKPEAKKPGIYATVDFEPDQEEIKKAIFFIRKHFVNYADVFERALWSQRFLYHSSWFFPVIKRAKIQELEGKISKITRWSFFEATLKKWKNGRPDRWAIDDLYDDDMNKIQPKSKTDAMTESLSRGIEDATF